MDELDLFLQAHQKSPKTLPINGIRPMTSSSDSLLIDELLEKMPVKPNFSPAFKPDRANRPLSPTSALLLRQVPPPVIQSLPPPPMLTVVSPFRQDKIIPHVDELEQKLVDAFRKSPCVVQASPSPVQSTTSPRFFESSPSSSHRSAVGHKNISPLGDKPLRRPKEPDRSEAERNSTLELQRVLSARETKIKELELQLVEERRTVANLKVKYTGENDQLRRKIEMLLEERLADSNKFEAAVKILCDENELLKRTVNQLKAEKEELITRLKNRESEVARLREECVNSHEEKCKIASANAQVETLCAENGKLREELAICVSTRSTLEACAKRMTEDIQRLEEEVASQKEAAESERSRMREEYENRLRGIRDCFLAVGSEGQSIPVAKNSQPEPALSTKNYFDLERQEHELLTKLMELPSRGLTGGERHRLTIQFRTQLKKVQAEMEYIKMAVSTEM